jgi:hypothetical protein
MTLLFSDRLNQFLPTISHLLIPPDTYGFDVTNVEAVRLPLRCAVSPATGVRIAKHIRQ